MARDFEAAERYGEIMLRAKASAEIARRALARQSEALGQRDKALSRWLDLRDHNPQDFEAAFHIARAACAQGATSAAAALDAVPNAPSAFRTSLQAVLEELPAAAREDGARHVAICGVSYSGSTLIDRLLGSLPGAASIGESHWLTKALYPRGYDTIDFGADYADQLVKCSVCGAHCKVLTPKFRRGLAADHADWYFRIADQIGTKTLISADKNPQKLADNDPLLRLDGLVVFKSLPQAWMSELHKRPPGKDKEYYRAECERYVAIWALSYRTYLEHFRPTGKVAFLSFEAFARDPAPVLEAACGALSLEFDAGVLTAIRPGHAIGGNARAMSRIRNTNYAPGISAPEPLDLPDSHLRLIEENAEAARISDLLQVAHKRMMQA
jgi:hypothetical protein